MKLVTKTDDGAVIELSDREIGIILNVGLEANDGAYRLSDEEWDTAVGVDRNEVAAVFDQLSQLTK